MRKTKLQKLFRRLNRKYFRNRLPDCRVQYDRKLWRDGTMGEHWCVGSDGHEIRITLKFKNAIKLAELTLLHEMVHLKFSDWRFPDGPHGKTFQKEMLSLARRGAFSKLW